MLDAHLKYGSASGRAEFGSLASDHITMEGWFLSLPIISFITSRWWARVVLSKFSALQHQADERKDSIPVGTCAAGHAVDTHTHTMESAHKRVHLEEIPMKIPTTNQTSLFLQ